MPRVGFEPTISAGERPKTYALDRAAAGTGYEYCIFLYTSVLVVILRKEHTRLLYPALGAQKHLKAQTLETSKHLSKDIQSRLTQMFCAK